MTTTMILQVISSCTVWYTGQPVIKWFLLLADTSCALQWGVGFTLFANMSIIDKLYDHKFWISFYDEKAESGNWNDKEMEDLFSFIKEKEYVPVVDKIRNGESFLPPSKRIISKQYSTKKRTVYTYSREENYVLKLFMIEI